MSEKTWFNISAKTDDSPIDLLLLDEIGGFGVSAYSLIRQLQNYPAKRRVRMLINSPGGSVFEGFALFNFLKGRGSVDTIVIGVAASMASVVALAGETVTIAKNGFMMVHSVSGGVMGQEQDVRSYAEMMAKLNATMEETYATETGASIGTVRSWLSGDTWFTSAEALAAGLADSVGETISFSAHADLSRFRNLPGALRAIVDSKTTDVIENTMKPEEISAAVEKNNDSIVSRIVATLNGDAALKARSEELTAKILGLEKTHAEAITAKDLEITNLKAAHGTALAAKDEEITKAKNEAQSALAKTGHTKVPADNGSDTTSGTDSSKKADELRAELATASEERKAEILAELRVIRGVAFSPAPTAKK